MTLPLSADRGVGRRLEAGRSDRFRGRGQAGQAIHLWVQQRSLDVSITVEAPGTRAWTVNAFERGTESATFVLRADGDFFIEVRPASSSQHGIYEIWLEHPVPPTAQDPVRAQAERETSEARAAAALGTADGTRKARALFQSSSKLWHSMRDLSAEARTLVQLGDCEQSASQYPAALQQYNAALQLAEQAADRRTQAEVHNNLGLLFWRQGKPQQSMSELELALNLWSGIETDFGRGATLSNLGLLCWQTGEWQDALDHYASALAVFRATGYDAGEAFVLNNIGLAYASLGRFEEAIVQLERAEQFFLNHQDRPAAARALGSLARINLLLRDPQRSRALLVRMFELLHDSADKRSLAEALNIRSETECALGDFATATRTGYAALDLFRSIEDRRGEAAALQHIGAALVAAGKAPEAMPLLERALEIRRQMEDRDSIATLFYLMASVHVSLGRQEEALPLLARAVEAVEATRTRSAGLDSRATYLAARIDYFQTYIDTLMVLHQRHPAAGYERMALEVAERGRARSLVESLAESRVELPKDVPPALRVQERAALRDLNYQSFQLARLLTAPHSPEAEQRAHRATAEATARYEAVDARVRAATPRYESVAGPRTLSYAEIQREIGTDATLLEFSLGPQRSYLWVVDETGIRTYTLDSREKIEAAAHRAIECFRDDRYRGACDRAVAAIGEFVLQPAAREFGAHRLIVVADGVLTHLPFAALPDPRSAEPLVVEHEIINLSSVSALAAQRRVSSGRVRAPLDLAVLADPVFSRDDPRLTGKAGSSTRPSPLGAAQAAKSGTRALQPGPIVLPRLAFSREEARRILSVVAPERRFQALDFDANIQTLSSEAIRQYRVVHLATHGFLDDQHPGLSGLVLSLLDRNGTPREGFLRLRDVYQLRLDADLVVLSACSTGLGQHIRGEGIIGLSRGFIYAGAAQTVVSLWNIDDEATAELMQHFYHLMFSAPGAPPAEALRFAQLRMLRDARWRLPYFWASFRLEGDWQ